MTGSFRILFPLKSCTITLPNLQKKESGPSSMLVQGVHPEGLGRTGWVAIGRDPTCGLGRDRSQRSQPIPGVGSQPNPWPSRGWVATATGCNRNPTPRRLVGVGPPLALLALKAFAPQQILALLTLCAQIIFGAFGASRPNPSSRGVGSRPIVTQPLGVPTPRCIPPCVCQDYRGGRGMGQSLR